jgi:hypothetical protein
VEGGTALSRLPFLGLHGGVVCIRRVREKCGKAYVMLTEVLIGWIVEEGL